MINRTEVSQRLYERYIAPTEREREDFIGVEIELPLVNLNQEAVDFEYVHEVTDHFLAEFHFEVSGRDDEGNIYAAEDPATGDILSYDCSYNNLELSFGRARTIQEVSERFKLYFNYLQAEFNKKQHMLTGMGINPYRNYNQNVPIPNERYRMLFHHLASYREFFQSEMHFHRYPTFGAFSSASQVQLDVNEDNLIQTIRAHSLLEPIKALLFSNSVLLGEREDLICCRDMLWENSTHGINPHNIGMFDALPDNLDDLQAYLESESLYCVEREGRYVNFKPINILEYFRAESITGQYYENGEYHTTQVIPEIDDIHYLRTFKFEDLTFRGTIEYRSGCCQPVSDAMVIAAFHTGLKERINELDELLRNDYVLYHHGYTATELRKAFLTRKRPAYLNEDDLYELAKQIVDLAKEGLLLRGHGEEAFLKPLHKRIEKRENPAEHLLNSLANGVSLEEMIKEYGTINQ